MNENVINVFNHENGDSFQIVTLEKFILWLNDNDEFFTFEIIQEKK